MKKTLLLALIAFSLTACADEKKPTFTDDINVQSKTIETATLGESCETKKCKSGLECNDEKICVETVALKNLFCPETQDPVCGRKGDYKNGYLNECEATRHGAEILYKGFCKVDPDVTGDCKANITRIGQCDTEFTGVEYNGKNCVEKSVSGCDAEIPFESIEACESTCSGFIKSIFK